MLRVLIVQNELPAYRVPLYRRLGMDCALTILHSGRPSGAGAGVFTEIVAPCLRLGSMAIQPRALKEAVWGRFDTVIAMFDPHWPVNVLLPLLPRSSRLLLWGHRYSHRRAVNWFRDRLLAMADGSIMYSREDFPDLKRRGVDMTKVYVADNTVQIDNATDCSGAPKSSFTFVGRLQPRKGVPELIAAFARFVAPIRSDLGIDIVGDGPEMGRCVQAAKEHGALERVRFHGAIAADDRLLPIFARSLAYVSPGPVGLGVLHSFAYGVPVITRRGVRHGPEFTNLLDGRNSIIYEEVGELGGVLARLARDESLARKLGREAFLLYDQERRMDRMVDGFRRAIRSDPVSG